jgi:hypothetical protein
MEATLVRYAHDFVVAFRHGRGKKSFAPTVTGERPEFIYSGKLDIQIMRGA